MSASETVGLIAGVFLVTALVGALCGGLAGTLATIVDLRRTRRRK